MTDQAYNVTADELRAFVERAEAQNARIKDETEVRNEIFAEAKARGYDIPTIRRVIALRKKTADDIAEEAAVLEMYSSALGMS